MAKASARMVAANLRMVACACAVVLLFARRGRAAREFVCCRRAPPPPRAPRRRAPGREKRPGPPARAAVLHTCNLRARGGRRARVKE